MPKKQYCYEYPRPMVTVDVVIVTREERPRILLIRRKHEPFVGQWELVEDQVGDDETEHRVAQKLQRLVVRQLTRTGLVRERAMGQGLVQAPALLEAIAESCFERREIVAQRHHLQRLGARGTLEGIQ